MRRAQSCSGVLLAGSCLRMTPSDSMGRPSSFSVAGRGFSWVPSDAVPGHGCPRDLGSPSCPQCPWLQIMPCFGDKRDLWLAPRGGACGLTGPLSGWRVSRTRGGHSVTSRWTGQARQAQIWESHVTSLPSAPVSISFGCKPWSFSGHSLPMISFIPNSLPNQKEYLETQP